MDEWELEDEEEVQPRDPATDAAKAALATFFNANPTGVWYERQLVVMFEQARRPRPFFNGEGFFHWIIARALIELAQERVIESKTLPLWAPVTDAALRGADIIAPQTIRFFWRRGARYVARRAEAIRKLVTQFSVGEFGVALGQQAEMMFDAALPTVGFMPHPVRNTRVWKGREWTATNHNFDRIFERDGIAYGAEIKNTLIYIPRAEMRTKLLMCRYLGLKPLFIVRMAPKSYIEEVRRQGGYTLAFEWQQYPYGTGAFAEEVRRELNLPVDCRARIEDGTGQRFLNWHLREHGLRP